MVPTEPPSPQLMDNEPSIRVTKRKLEDAFQSLDNAVGPKRNSDRPSIPKRPHTSRSLYATLAKYGITSKEPRSAVPLLLRSQTAPELGKTTDRTPHLTAILARAATRTKNAFTFKFSPSATPVPGQVSSTEYRPSSLQSFLSRLETYKLATYANKPSSIDAVAASRCGWINDGRDRLVCGFCNASWVVAGREGMNRDAANALIEKQRKSLVDNHKSGCPWKTRQCDPSIYCIPLQSPSSMVEDLKANAVSLNAVLEGVAVRHPLVTLDPDSHDKLSEQIEQTQSQLHSLKSTIASYELALRTENSDKSDDMDVDDVRSPVEPSDAAILTSLFGWTLVPPITIQPFRRTSTKLNSSAIPSHSSTPSCSRRSSISLSRSPPDESRTPIFRMPPSLLVKQDNTLLQCHLCQRRIGLWAFGPRKTDEAIDEYLTDPSSDAQKATSPKPRPRRPLPQRQFDLLKEHRSYCPYAIRSTMIPSTPNVKTTNQQAKPTSGNSRPSPSQSQINVGRAAGSVLEGWRAVLTVVLRYGMAQKQSIEYEILGRNTPNDEQGGDMDNVKAMVAGVKSSGGRDLLKYVKYLLG